MSKIIIQILIYTNLLFAGNYSFSEIRYSDALEKSMTLEGEIRFLKDGLNIKYLESKKSLDYNNGILKYFEDSKEIEMPIEQTQKIIQYFEILILIHNSNDESLKDIFLVKKTDDKTELVPTDILANYVIKIELLKTEEKLKEIKLFLKNSDYIKISIYDEI